MEQTGGPPRWQTTHGDPITVDDVRLTTEARSLIVRWPAGGFVWSRPVAVTIERQGQVARVPIKDVTRTAQIVLWGLSIVFALLSAKKRGKRQEAAE